MDQRILPAHLVDHFIVVSTSLARRRTAIAQALMDSGIVMLLSAVIDGVYTTIRQQMCAEAFAVLGERL